MKTVYLQLPKEFHSKVGLQKDIVFSMSRRHYEVNGVQYDNPLNELFIPEFKGYMSHVMNKSITITLFYNSDILRSI